MVLGCGRCASVQLCEAGFGGTMAGWPAKPAITEFPFAHTVLWNKEFDPSSTWLQTRFTTNDRRQALDQVHQLQRRFAGKFVNHIEFVRIPEGLNPSGLPAVFTSDPREIDAMINFCAEIGV